MKVSVIIPTYNRADLVTQTIDSVLQQSFTDREIIVIDDGSTDDTQDRLSPYLDRIRYIRQPNSGVNAARNTGLQVARGEFIALLDSDDLWMDFKLELDVAILDKFPDVGFVYSDFIIAKPDGTHIKNGIRSWYTHEDDWNKLFRSARPLPTSFVQNSTENSYNNFQLFFGDIYHSSLFHPTVLPSASLYRRSMVDNVIILNESDSTCGDWEFFARLSHEHGAAFINMETTYNRSHEDAVRLTRIDSTIQLRRRIALINRMWRKDSEFMSTHAQEVNDQLYSLYCDLIKELLVAGDRRTAREKIAELQNDGIHSANRRLLMLKALEKVPGTPLVLKLLRSLNHIIS